MNFKEVTLFIRSEDGKKDYQTYRVGTTRTEFVLNGKSKAKVEDIELSADGAVVISVEGGKKLVYANTPARFVV